MSEKLYDALEVCLRLMDEGTSLEECLARYPMLSEELRPTLEAAYAAQCLTETVVPLEAMNRSRTRLLGKAAQLRKEKAPRRVWLGLPRLAFSLIILVMLLVTTSGGLFVASAKSLPGDTLYPVKRAVESLRVNLAPGEEQKNDVESEFRLQRIDEVRQLFEMKLRRNISFEGVVEQITAERWLVSGIAVRVSSDTQMIGEITPGMLVEVEGSTEVEGYVTAIEIHLREFQTSGLVEAIGQQEWMISGVRVNITSETQISPGIAEGEVVLVLVRSFDDQTWTAMAILDLGAPTATPTPQPTLTDTPLPEATETEDVGDDDSSGSDSGDDDTEPQESEDDSEGDSESGDDESTPEADESDDDSSASGDEESENDENESDESSGSEDEESTPEPEETDEP